MIVKVPATVRAIGEKIEDMPGHIKRIIDECNNDMEMDHYITDEAFLTKAILRDAAGSAKDIVRIFETENGEEFGLINSVYGLLEKQNGLRYYEDDNLKALIVYSNKRTGEVEALFIDYKKEEEK